MQLTEPQTILVQWALNHYPLWALPILGTLAGWSLRGSKGADRKPRRNWSLNLQVGGDEQPAQNETAKHGRRLSQTPEDSPQ
jgi:hypothetical protein